MVANCTPCERSVTNSLVGQRVAARRRRRSASCSSGTRTSNGRTAVTSASVRGAGTAPAMVVREVGSVGADICVSSDEASRWETRASSLRVPLSRCEVGSAGQLVGDARSRGDSCPGPRESKRCRRRLVNGPRACRARRSAVTPLREAGRSGLQRAGGAVRPSTGGGSARQSLCARSRRTGRRPGGRRCPRRPPGLVPSGVPHVASTPTWRWRESNPRPPTPHQGFSERSSHCLCSTPPIMRTSRCDGPSRCWVSHAYPRPARAVSHLADARIRADDEPGLTDPPSCCQAARAKSR